MIEYFPSNTSTSPVGAMFPVIHLNKEQHEALAVVREFIKGISAEGLRYCHKVLATFRGYCTIVKGEKVVSPQMKEKKWSTEAR